MLVPVIGLVQVGSHSMADRYTYLPQIGLCLSVTWGVAQLAASWRYRRWVCGVASALAVLVLMGIAWQQTSYWQDSEALWTHTLASTANNYCAHFNVGVALAGRGQVDAAIDHYQRALEIKPDYAEAHNNLGSALAGRREMDAAIVHYRKAIEIRPAYAEAHNNLGVALEERGQVDTAIVHYQKALEIKPDNAAAHYNLGLALDRQGKIADAVIQWRETVRLQPNNTMFLNRLAWVLATCPAGAIRNGAEAIDLALRAVRLTDGREPAILNTLAAAYAEAGRFSEAVKTAERAVSLASARGDGNTALADTLRARIKLYQAGFPYREMRPQASRN
jgi:tetratricopeptide (TPR) repeat protein